MQIRLSKHMRISTWYLKFQIGSLLDKVIPFVLLTNVTHKIANLSDEIPLEFEQRT